MDLSTYHALKLERRGRALWITLDSPMKNAVTPPMHAELARIFYELARDDETAVVVVTGAGNVFSAGGDLANMQRNIDAGNHEPWLADMREARILLQGLLALNKPLVARVNGHAMGLGATLAAYADISFMVDDAIIADTHVNMGLAAGDGGSLLWPLLMGFNRARRYLLTGDVIRGREAQDLGLITFAVPRDELDARVDEMVDRLANGATRAINATKVAINLTLRTVIDSLIEAHLGLEADTHFSDDHKIALDAFLSGGKPVFTGK